MSDGPASWLESPHAQDARGLVRFALDLDLTQEASRDALAALAASALRNAAAAEREACARAVEALAETTGRWAEADGPESIAALKASTYHNAAAAVRARGEGPSA